MFYLCQHSLQNLGQPVWLDTGMSPCLCLYLVCMCALCAVCSSQLSATRVWEGGEQSCFKTICSSEYFSGGLSLWFDQRTSQANSKAQAVSRACSGKKKKSSSFSLAQWAVFCAQGSHSLSPCPRATVKLCGRYSQWKCSSWHSRVFVWEPFWFVGAISIL